MTKKQKKELSKEVLKRLKKQRGSVEAELNWDKNYPYQLVVAVILSAQATDIGVNKATLEMFKKYKTPEDFAKLNYADLEPYTKTINFYKGKTERIIKNAITLLDLYKGIIPKTIAELIKLPGVGRKSANVILQEVYNIGEGVVVDTHMTRVTNRLGIQNIPQQKNAVKVEAELNSVIDPENYKDFSQLIVLHGRYVCKARKPNCEECHLSGICTSSLI